MTTCVTYSRVSTAEQRERGYSLRQQKEALRAYCLNEGWEIVAEAEDGGHSGASLERPGLDRVRDLVAGGGINLVVAQDRDRFARERPTSTCSRRSSPSAGRGCGRSTTGATTRPKGS
jgi:site-specific DNA recombinase